MSDMAGRIEKVLMEHRVITDGLHEPTGWCETCGNLALGDQEAHQAFALAAAGFGPAREAQAVAWDEGMTFAALLLNADELTPSFRKDNPYRAVTVRGGE